MRLWGNSTVMDWQFLVGVGLTVILGFLPFAVKEIPQWITFPGITAGLQLPTPLPRGAMSESMGRWTAVICRT
jgi:hypothetical protein